MRLLAGIFRLAAAGLAIAGTFTTWSGARPWDWVFFTNQTNLLFAFVMLWAGAASLVRGVQPPAWLKGCVTLYMAITGLVAWLVLPPATMGPETVMVLGLATPTIVHVITPIMAGVDFLLFDAHRRFAWHYVFSWMIYFPLYLAFVLLRAAMLPDAPLPNGSLYPYPFVDVSQLGWAQLGMNAVTYLGAFLAGGLLLFLVDRLLPERALLG